MMLFDREDQRQFSSSVSFVATIFMAIGSPETMPTLMSVLLISMLDFLRYYPPGTEMLSFVSIGTFLGYSSLRIAARTPDDVLIVTVESNAQSAEIARRIHEHAGVAHRIYIVVNSTDKAIPRLRNQFHVDSFDFIFIDHHKEYYLQDLKLLEHEGLIKRGTMVVADNVLMPGAPDYLRYVRNSPHYTSTIYQSHVEYSNDMVDGVEVSVRL